MSDIYDNVPKGSLKLKGVSDGKVKKKKKKSKHSKEKDEEKLEKAITTNPKKEYVIDHRTKAEIAFQKKQEERDMELIMKKASKTHKERIMEFNGNLDKLTEHYDIPKVSWTK